MTASPHSEPAPAAPATSVAVVTLGCARNEVDSEELAGRLSAGGFRLVEDADQADAVLVNTCGFIESAKKDSIDALLDATDRPDGGARTVVAVGCLAERYGAELAATLPETDAVLSFDDYPDIAVRLGAIVAGERHDAHVPRDRRALLPITPIERGRSDASVPGHLAAPDRRTRLSSGPVAPLKLASGCDRRCAFCAIPSFRGAFVSRPADDVLAEARWLAAEGVRELFLVSENTTSYGKDLGDVRLLERLLPQLAGLDGITRVRASYLQPAEVRPGLLDVLAGTPGVAAYFDLSFQHASGPLLRRMRRFGDAESFLALLDSIRTRAPEAGVRSNLIVGFPGETEADLEVLCDFVTQARLDVVGVFGYSDEDGTEAAGYDGKLPADEITARVARVSDLVEELTSQRAEDRIGERVDVLVEHVDADAAGGAIEGRAAHQGPEVDGTTTIAFDAWPPASSLPGLGDLVPARVVGAHGADLLAVPIGASR